MLNEKAKTLLLTGSVLAVVVLGAACQTDRSSLHDVVYPPDFSYLPEDRLKGSMWILAGEIQHLDELLRTPADTNDARLQKQVQSSLLRIAAAVEQIDTPGRATQHPALNRNLSSFARRVSQAQRGAERTPPNYFQASALSGSCFLCHGSADDAGAG